MTSSTPSSDPSTRTSTPSRFTAQSNTAEDLLKSQTVGLVHLSDFRKRRAEALEQKEREAQDRSLGRSAHGGGSGESGATTPGGSDGYVILKSERSTGLMVKVQRVDTSSRTKEEAKEGCLGKTFIRGG